MKKTDLKPFYKKRLRKNVSQKLVSLVFVTLLLCSVLSGMVSAENFVDESDALSETLCCNDSASISGSGDSATSNSPNNNSLSPEIDRFLYANKPVFLFFYADWCHFCQQQKPIIDELEHKYAEEIAFFRVNAEENLQALNEFSVTGFPAMFLIVDKNDEGYIYWEFGGFTEKEVLEGSFDSVVENGNLPEGFTLQASGSPVLSWAKECKCPPGSTEGKRHKESYVYDIDGCSVPPWLQWGVVHKDNPVGWPGCSFYSACAAHDDCYQTCNTNWKLKNWEYKIACDSKFHSRLVDACISCPLRDLCMNYANAYYAAVLLGGWGPFARNQEKACEDCSCGCAEDADCAKCQKCEEGLCVPKIPCCGNGVCEGCETEVNCPRDCKRPGNDHPDDNYDVSTSVEAWLISDSSTTPEVTILSSGFATSTVSLLESLNEPTAFVDIDFSPDVVEDYSTLIIPTGGLYGLDSSLTFKSNLEQYVKNGGTLIVFSQQHGYEYGALPGGNLSGFGWLEDQSCHHGSVGISTYHPILSGQDSVTSDVNVDGYFTSYPDNATVLLSRTKNGMPAMLTYEYGEGRVIATTAYTDWAYGRGQATQDGIHLVRDMIAWAKEPAEIPEYGMSDTVVIPVDVMNVHLPIQEVEYPQYELGDVVSIPVDITNGGNETSDKVVFSVFDPDYDMVDIEVSVSIPTGETMTVDFTYETTESPKTGVYLVVYSLYAGETVIGGGFGSGFILGVDIAEISSYNVNFTLSDPDKKIVQEETATVTVPPGEIEAANFTYANPSTLGIWSLEYEVWDYNDTLIDYGVERFAVSKYAENPDGWVYQGSELTLSATTPDDHVATGSEVVFTVYVKNDGDSDFNGNIAVGGHEARHEGGRWWAYYGAVTDITVPAHSQTSYMYSHRMDYSTAMYFGLFEEGVEYEDKYWHSGAIAISERGVWIFHPSIAVDIQTDKQVYTQEENVSTFLNLKNKQDATYEVNTTIRVLDPNNQKFLEDTFDVTLPSGASDERTFNFFLPTNAKCGVYLVSAEAHVGDDKGGSGSTYFEVRKGYIVRLGFDHPSKAYRARESMTVDLEAINEGPIPWSSAVDLSIPDLNFSESADFALDPGQTDKITYNLSIPADIAAGKHDITLTVQSDNSQEEYHFLVPQSELVLAVDRTSYNAGEDLSISLTNAGGVDTTCDCSIELYNPQMLRICENNSFESVLAGESKALTVAIPGQAVSGHYPLIVSCEDLSTGRVTKLSKSITVDGLDASLTSITDKKAYFNDEDISIQTEITNLDGEIVDGALNLKITQAAHEQEKKVRATHYDGSIRANDLAHYRFVDGSGNGYVNVESNGIGTRSDYATIKYTRQDTEPTQISTPMSMSMPMPMPMHTPTLTANNQHRVAHYDESTRGSDYVHILALDRSRNNYVIGRSQDSSNSPDYAMISYDGAANETWVARPGSLTLQGNGSISGFVYEDDGVTPIEGATVKAVEWDASPIEVMSESTTDANGTYIIANLSAGDYRVYAYAPEYGREFYQDTYFWNDAQPVSVTEGQETPNINFSLGPGGSISGRITSADSGTPLSQVSVFARFADGTHGALAGLSDDNGNYTIIGIPYSTYKVLSPSYARFGSGDDNYTMEFWQEKATWDEADIVTVAEGINPTGIDFTLEGGGSLSGTVLDQHTGEPVDDASCGSIDLDAGWHKFVYRHQENEGGQTCRAAFKAPGDTEWRWFSTSELEVNTTLGPDAESGIMLTNKKNTWDHHPENHGELVACVDVDSTEESGWYGYSVVNTVNQNENIHGNDDYYTSYYEGFFYVDAAGTWQFSTDSDDASEIVIDDQVVAHWYQGHGSANRWEHKMEVSLHWYDTNEWVKSTRGDADGNYTFENIPLGSYRVEATAPGYVTEFFEESVSRDDATPVVVTAPDDASDINFTLEVGGTISGYVYREDGMTPLSNVHVNAKDYDTDVWMQGTSTNQDGSYTITGLPTGTYLVRAMASESGLQYVDEFYDNVYAQNAATQISVTAPNDTPNINFTLEVGGTISGHVYQSDGVTPSPGLYLYAEDYYTGAWIEDTNTNQDGSYSLVLPTGTYRVRACPSCSGLNYVSEWYDDAYIYNEATPVSVTVPNDTPNIDFTLEIGGTISGHVYQEDGVTPIPNVHVYAEDYDMGEWMEGTNTNKYGYYSLILPTGTYRVRACPSCNGLNYVSEWYDDTHNKWEATAVSVTVPVDIPDINFILEPGGTISGYIYKEDGVTPLPDVHVYAKDFDTGTGVWMEGTNTDKCGSYSLVVPTGTYRVRACPSCNGLNYVSEWYDSTHNWEEATAVSVTAPDDTPGIDFTLEVGGTISGFVYQEDGVTPIPNVHVEAKDYDTNVWTAGTDTDQDGYYSLVLPTGTYRVRARPSRNGLNYVSEWYDDTHNEWEATAVSVTAPDDTPNINFTLKVGGTVSGFVYMEDGVTPIPNVHVNAKVYDTNVWMSGTSTDQNGHYSLVLPTGTYRVRACPSCSGINYVSEWYDDTHNEGEATAVSVTVPDDTPNINFALDVGGTISGYAYKEDGVTPIPNVHVYAEDYDTNVWMEGTNTNKYGYYSLVLPTGTYRVRACPSCNGLRYVSKWYNSTHNWVEASAVSVTAPDDTPDTNFTLEVGGTISGYVYQEDGVTPIPNVHVYAEDYDIRVWMEGTNTDKYGYYSLVLPTGTYRVRACPSCNGLDYFDEWYDGTRNWEEATAVSVTAPNDTPDINFALIRPTLTLAPSSGPVGTLVTVSGYHMTPESSIPVGGITFAGISWNEVEIPIDSMGNIAPTTLIVPMVGAGPQTVVATDSDDVTAQAIFTVTSTVWEKTIPIDISVSEVKNVVTNISIPSEMPYTTGKFNLVATLYSSSSQIINQSDRYSFFITDQNLSLTLETDREIYKPNEAIKIYGEVQNNANMRDDYNLSLKKEGVEIFFDTFTLDPGEIYNFTTFTASNTSFTLEATVDGVMVTDFVEVESPVINVSVIAPDVVGLSPFDVGVLIENIGNIVVDLGIHINSTWNVTIPEGESRLLDTTMNITKNTTLNVTISGDVNKTIQKEIICGENATMFFDTQGLYLEGPVEIPVIVKNTGFLDTRFNATFSIGDRVITRSFTVLKDQSINDTLYFNLTKGVHILNFRSPFETGSGDICVAAPEFVVISSPANLTLNLGEDVILNFTVRNEGGAEGMAELNLTIPGIYEDTNFAWIKPDEEQNICFNFIMPDDLEEKSYKAFYEVNGGRGEFSFLVQGANISVNAYLDKTLYEENGTAVLTLNVENNRNMDLRLYSRVKFNEYENIMYFNLTGLESTTLTFNAPVTFGGDNKMLYTVYTDSGRALYINSIYVYEKKPEIRLYTDKDVYNIGEDVIIHIAVTKTDLLNLTAPNFTYSDTISGSTTLEFALPELRSGTYYIEYRFGNFSSAYPFDVIGYSARILEASLNKEKYYNGDVLKLKMNIEANKNTSGLLKTWMYDPEDELIDEFAVNKTLVKGENEVEISRTLSTKISGIHVIVYGFYANLSGHSLTMLASGAEYFDAKAEDTTPPIITFVSPTPANNSEVNVDYVFVNVTLNENGNTAILNWNGVNETMLGAETNFYLNKTGLSTGAYVYKVYVNDTVDNWNASETRVVSVNVTLAKPDLEITAIWCELLRKSKKANTYFIYYNITNNGDAEAGRSFSNLTVDGNLTKKRDGVKPLAVGETRTEFFRYRSATPPDTIMVCADYNNKMVESNETNNYLEVEVTDATCIGA